MASSTFKIAATFQLHPDSREKVLSLVQQMENLDPGTDGKSEFSSAVDNKSDILTLSLVSQTETAQQVALLVYGPHLGVLADLAPRLSLNCTENAPVALKAMLTPMAAEFSANV